MPDAMLTMESKQKSEAHFMREYRGEIVLVRSSRRELLADLEAVGQFLDDRRARQKHTSADAVKIAEGILRRAA
jgi:hypothetical protein